MYENLERLRADHGGDIPISVATAGDLGEAITRSASHTGGRFAAVPFWVEGADGKEAPGRRQCTREYKIAVVQKAVRTMLGLSPGQRAAGLYRVEEWIGISTDEATRAKPARYSWVTTRWPLLFDEPMSRAACKGWMSARSYPIPGKSACIFCPYRKAIEYARIREQDPGVFEEACRWDDLIRSKGTMKGIRGQQYVLRTLVPLRDLPPLEALEKIPSEQLNLFENECEGMCGV